MLSAAFICLTPTARGMFLLTNRSVGFHQVLQSLNIIDFVMLLTLHGFLVAYLSLLCLQALGVCTQASVEIGYHCSQIWICEAHT
jgi:hypothetical protein